MFEQTSTGCLQNQYEFNGKELDQETGLYYYGVRYYDLKGRLWLSVDPLTDEYRYLSPYCYAVNNPISFIDPDGRNPIYAKNFWGRVKQIGDDSNNSTGSYLVRGSVARDVKTAIKAGVFYICWWSLSEPFKCRFL